jgi:NAD-dependent SIR2 family protein deacetylase
MKVPGPDLDANLHAAADAILSAEGILIGAGAGMGVDSGLPDFRGPEGFWKAYPAFRGREFAELSTPHWFRTDPELAWGFFGHRLNLYRATVPHAGFAILQRWAEPKPGGAFVFTSNVDGHFQKAGFAQDTIVERHGSIHFLQCVASCGRGIWPTEDLQIDVDESTIRAVSELPRCSECGALARPNILMFDDWHWDQLRTAEQLASYRRWLRSVQGQRVVVIELGAGLAIPTVRRECEALGQVLIRINPHESDALPGGISLPLGARDALARIDALL